jgi:hypothetical protein
LRVVVTRLLSSVSVERSAALTSSPAQGRALRMAEPHSPTLGPHTTAGRRGSTPTQGRTLPFATRSVIEGRVVKVTFRPSRSIVYDLITEASRLSRRNRCPSIGQPGACPAVPGTIPQSEVDALRTAWARNPNDLGLGHFNPSTGEIHVGSYDTTGRIGHDGLQNALGIPDTDRPNWRGFVISSGGQAINNSAFNNPDGGVRMLPASFAQVEDALRRAGLI